jgi:hypothetical protein
MVMFPFDEPDHGIVFAQNFYDQKTSHHTSRQPGSGQ